MDAAPPPTLPVRTISVLADGARLWVLATVFGVLAAVASFGHGVLLMVDEPLSELARGRALLDEFRVVTTLGATVAAVGLSLVLAGLLWRRCRTFAVLYPATLLAGVAVNVALKWAIGRPRPPMPDTGVALASFPSGHTLHATLLLGLLPLAVALLGARRVAVRATAVASAAGIAAVALSRVYLGAHWPTDVVAAVLVGAAVVAASEAVLVRRHRHGRCRCPLATPGAT